MFFPEAAACLYFFFFPFLIFLKNYFLMFFICTYMCEGVCLFWYIIYYCYAIHFYSVQCQVYK